MKAVLREIYGKADVLQIKEVEIPNPSSKEVLVKVYSTTVNRTDCGGLTGKPLLIRCFIGLIRPKDKITGTDFAGQIMAIGEDVVDFKVGDRVFGLDDEGLQSHAEYLTIKEDRAIAKIPDSTSYSDAAASAEGAHYARNTINKITLEKGDKVLVNGATGAIGSSAIQLLKLHDVEITAICHTHKVDLIKSLGVHKVVDYMKEDFTKLSEKYKFVFDTVGKSRFKYAKNIMTIDGIYISSELGPNAENLFLPLFTKFFSKKKVIFPIPSDCRKSILEMSKLLEAKKFIPLIDRIYPMDDIKEAYKFVQTGMKTGNVILKILD